MRIFKKVINILILIFIVLTSLSALFSGIAGSLTDSEKFADKILTDEYYSLCMDNVRDCIDSNSSIIDIGTDGAMEAMSKEKIKLFVARYITGLTEKIIDNKSEQFDIEFTSTELMNYIKLRFENFEDQNDEATAEFGSSADYVTEAYDALISDINVSLRFISEKYFDKGMSYIDNGITSITGGRFSLASVYAFMGKLDSIFIFSLIAAVLLSLIYLLINYRKITRHFFVYGSVLFITSVAAFVPIVTVKIFDISSKLALADSPLGKYVVSFFHIIESSFLSGAIIFLCVSAIILAVASVFWIITERKHNKKIDNISKRRKLEKQIREEDNPEDVKVLI